MSAATLANEDGRRPPWIALLAIVALGTLALVLGATLSVAGDTLGYDFLAYHAAAVRLIDGRPLYDTSFEAAGGFGLFYYPPQFAAFVLPFGLLPAEVATGLWIGLLIAAFGVGTMILPVSVRVRWLVVLLAGLSWPFAYAVKLGQVGPLLYLLFAVGWRWLDRPAAVGISAALGTAVKLQPALVLVWAALVGRWRAVAVGIVAFGVLSLVALSVAGTGAWFDFLDLIRRVSDPITTPNNVTVGAVAHRAGLEHGAASLIQLVSMAAVAAVVVAAARWTAADASYLVAVVASQLLSPILWDHYAMLLLLPVAWLLERRHWWAVLIPLATSIVLVGTTPPVAYPLAFGLTLVALLAVGCRQPVERAA